MRLDPKGAKNEPPKYSHLKSNEINSTLANFEYSIYELCSDDTEKIEIANRIDAYHESDSLKSLDEKCFSLSQTLRKELEELKLKLYKKKLLSDCIQYSRCRNFI